MQFLGHFGKIVCWHPLGSWRPLLGEILDPPLCSAEIMLNQDTRKPCTNYCHHYVFMPVVNDNLMSGDVQIRLHWKFLSCRCIVFQAVNGDTLR